MSSSTVSTPRVSVIMSVYNMGYYLLESIQSILDQTYEKFEFIIINDGSTDSTNEILEDLFDPRLKIIENTSNKGLIYSLNLGIEKSVGEYIARMDADDISLMDRFDKQIRFLEENNGVIAVGTRAIRIDPTGKQLESMISVTDPIDVMNFLHAGMSPIIHSSVMMRSKELKNIGGYRDAFMHAEDYDLWLRLSDYGLICNLKQKLMFYRSNPQGIRLSEVVTAARSSEYAYDCYLRRKNRMNERPFMEFISNVDLSGIVVRRLWSSALELLMFGEIDKVIYTLSDLLDKEPKHSKAKILIFLLQQKYNHIFYHSYRLYRKYRGYLIDSPFVKPIMELRYKQLIHVGENIRN